MKLSALIEAARNEIVVSGDIEVRVFCPHHSGEDGDPVAIHGFGWWGGQNGQRAAFIDCYECHDDAVREKIQDEVSADLEVQYGQADDISGDQLD